MIPTRHSLVPSLLMLPLLNSYSNQNMFDTLYRLQNPSGFGIGLISPWYRHISHFNRNYCRWCVPHLSLAYNTCYICHHLHLPFNSTQTWYVQLLMVGIASHQWVVNYAGGFVPQLRSLVTQISWEGSHFLLYSSPRKTLHHLSYWNK